MPTQAHLPLRGILRMLAPVAFSLLFSVVCQAADDAKQSFDLPAGDAEKTLKLFTQQSGEQILYPPTKVSGIQTNAVKGEMTAGEALNTMLDKTQLVAVRDNQTGAYTVQKAATVAEAEKNGSSRPVNDRAAVEKVEGVVKLDTFEVFGKKSLNMDIQRSRDDAQPYVVFDRLQIEQSAASNIEDFLKQRLSMNTQSATNSQVSPAAGNTSQINLHGLGTNQTLILVDGHRVATSTVFGAAIQADLNGIPLGAVERIEVLPTTASGIYGGSATGGVVNVILRRDYSGAELKLTYDNTFDSDTAVRRVELNAGFNLNSGKTNVLIATSYFDANDLLVQDRDLTQRGRAKILTNNPAAILNASTPPLGTTANIRSSTGANLTLRNGTPLNSPIVSVPVGYAGASTDGGAAFLANAGKYNLALANSAGSGGGRAGLRNSPMVESLSLTVRHQFAPAFHAFLEGAASNNNSYFPNNSFVASYSVPVTAPTNPFNQAVQVTIPVPAADGVWVHTLQNRRLVGGLIFKLPGDWKAEADYTWNRTRTFFQGPPVQASTGTTAVTTGALDVFRDGNALPIDFTPFFAPGSRVPPAYGTLRDATIRVAGSLGALPAGNATISALLENRVETFGDAFQLSSTSSLKFPSRSQSVNSVYVGAEVPIFAVGDNIPGLCKLDLQVSGRWDDYTVKGSNGFINLAAPAPLVRAKSNIKSVDPTIGVRYSPVEGLTMRGSYGTGFLPPGVNQLVQSAPLTLPGAVLGLTDPRRGGEGLGVTTFTPGGNPNLQAEESESASFGVVLSPPVIPGLRVSLDWIRIDKVNEIRNLQITQATLLALDQFMPERITRAAAAPGDIYGVGPINALNVTMANIAKTTSESYDLSLDYAYRTERWGEVLFSSAVTRAMHYQTQFIAGAPIDENVGVGGSFSTILKYKGNASITWKYRAWTVNWLTSYFGHYKTSTVAATILSQGGGGLVPSQTYHDVAVKYAFGLGGQSNRRAASLLQRTELQVGIRNIFNVSPPFDANAAATFYSQFGDPRLASYYISLKRSF